MATIPLERLSAKQGLAFIDRVHAMRIERLERERVDAERRAELELHEREKEARYRRMEERLRQEIEEDLAFELESAEIAREARKELKQYAVGFAIALGLVTLIAVV